ncbi:glycosyltransferase family 39 protein [Rhizohabitans arisaemae]|uniref:glycosyltransferase family 39 protein n=1 Tax=Rhizohabitans arisaemae TaxID=2720610 RepID=UPI0024B03FA6|nr:glycosyltransferase family 39 protein [Rhizohabitans arisaemae]
MEGAPSRRADLRRRLTARAPAMIGVLAFVLFFAGSWTPSLWSDELATRSGVSRTLPAMWELLSHRDAVFLPYYLFMKVWTLPGVADWWLRLPSAIAMAAAVGLTTDLGRRLWSPRAGICAGIVLMILPSISRYGQEARSYAFAVAAAVFSFWALHRALDGRGRGTYALSVALLPLTHLFAVLVLPAHLVVTALRGGLRRLVPYLLLGSITTLLTAVLSFRQQGQVSWLERPGWENLAFVRSTSSAWLPDPEPGYHLAVILGWLITAAGLAGAAVLAREPGHRPFAAGLVVWGVLPTLALYAASYALSPVYNSRYILFAAPAFALLTGAVLARVRPAAAIAVLALLTLLPVRQQLALRAPDGHGQDFAGAAQIIRSNLRPGDVIVYAMPWARDGVGRAGADDVYLRTPAARTGTFDAWEAKDVLAPLEGRRRVWLIRPDEGRWIRPGTADVVSRHGLTGPAVPKVKALIDSGFTVERTWRVRDVGVILVTR